MDSIIGLRSVDSRNSHVDVVRGVVTWSHGDRVAACCNVTLLDVVRGVVQLAPHDVTNTPGDCHGL